MSKGHIIFIIAFVVTQTLADGPKGPPPIEDKVECRKGFTEFFDERCCGEEAYTMGHVTALLQHYKDCAVEPEKNTLTIRESQWIYYDCLIQKSLGSNEITPKSYVNMMAGSLSDSKKAAILEAVEKDVGAAGSDTTPLSRQLWSKYFDAEVQVCRGNARKNSEAAPSLPFKSGDAPAIMFLPTTTRRYYICQRHLVEKHNNKNENFTQAMYPVCILTTSGLVSEEDLASKAMDYGMLLNVFLPKYLSQSSKTKLVEAIKDGIKMEIPDLGTSPSDADISKAIADHYQADVDSLPEADKVLFLNGITGYIIILSAAKSFQEGSNPKIKDF